MLPPLKEDRVLQDISHRGGYKANKIDRRIFESSGDLGVPKITKPALTVPKSPSFTKRTHPARPTSTATTFKSPPRHALPQHQHYRKFRPVIAQQGLVSSAESARRLSQEKLKRSIKPAATTVPQPDPSRSRGAKPELTIPKPFKLETDARGERYQEQFRFKLDKWKQIEKDHQFKALPLPVYPEKFVPARSTKPLTHTEPPRLRTDDRAHVREVLEQEKQRKGKIMQEMRAEKAREDELREQQELRELRLRLVPHPTPIRDYPRIDIHKSSRPLTVPRSPSIGEKRKRQMTLEREVPDAQAEEGIHRQVSSIVDGKRRREMTLEREVPRTSEERHYH
ncbi:hypothetical protein BGZ54_001148 [Gamsiella multidivaricata]|nr:hypothetical protein BGZ54_001148 [Gamsiella multidivaricata]